MRTSRFQRFGVNELRECELDLRFMLSSCAHVARRLVLVAVLVPADAGGQTLAQRGFIEGRGQLFPQSAPNDPTRTVGDLVVREEIFAKPAPWLRFAVGVDLRASSHDQVDTEWRVDASDRGAQRPRLSLRRATATIVRGPVTVDVGKQFIRWGKTDILNPTDRLAPRDFLNVLDTDFLGVTGARVVVQVGTHDSIDAAWLPRFTPSRIPLLNQRWTAVPADAPRLQIVDAGAAFPKSSETGIRWSHVGDRVEYSASFFDGFNHLPNIATRVIPELTPASLTRSLGPTPTSVEGAGAASVPELDVTRVYPRIRTYGADLALPIRWLTIKGEIAYFMSSSSDTDEYVLYVVQVERQSGEWVLLGGYAGQRVTERRAALAFAPDRGLTDALVGRASYTIDANRSLAVETAVRQTLDGLYGKIEYSQAHGQHWRTTVSGVIIRGDPDDFLGQYRRNSHVSAVLRYSF
jgi:hypothetical protein